MRRALVFGWVGLALLLGLAGCAEKAPSPSKLNLRPVAFSDLPGWTTDRVDDAMPVLAKSCGVLARKNPEAALGVAGNVAAWLPVCEALQEVAPGDAEAARRFLENALQPYAVVAEGGLFTGYYEAELRGASQQGGVFQTPLWQRPDDMIEVNLGDFKPEFQGKKLQGKVVGHRLTPYDTRAEVMRGGLAGRAKPLLWVDDPVAAFFLEIQGSGRVKLDDGQVMRVGYDAQNGRDYVAIGRVMADEGLLQRPVTMDKIRGWLKAHPDQAAAVMARNPSVVFFRRVENGPVGAEGVVLTPGRSLAVDPAFVPLGVPLWLDAEDPRGGRLQRLMVAQDTGGAIKGVVRGDVFWGAGPEAEALAGPMQSAGTYYLLLPKGVGDERTR